MSFRCFIERGGVSDLEFFLDDGVIGAVPIGVDTETLHTYFLSVSLQQFLFGDSELAFWIDEFDERDRHCFTHWDPVSLRRVIPAEARALIRRAVLHATYILVDAVKPLRVTMSTMGPLPLRALAKYEEIVGIFTELGYRVNRLDIYHGVLTWCLDRVVIEGEPEASGGDNGP